MAVIINPTWQQQMIDRVEKGREIDIILGFPKATQWLITMLGVKGVTFKVINVGTGVKRITTNMEICSKCNGTGRC